MKCKCDYISLAKCDKYSDDFAKLSDVRLDVSEVERWTNRDL